MSSTPSKQSFEKEVKEIPNVLRYIINEYTEPYVWYSKFKGLSFDDKERISSEMDEERLAGYLTNFLDNGDESYVDDVLDHLMRESYIFDTLDNPNDPTKDYHKLKSYIKYYDYVRSFDSVINQEGKYSVYFSYNEQLTDPLAIKYLQKNYPRVQPFVEAIQSNNTEMIDYFLTQNLDRVTLAEGAKTALKNYNRKLASRIFDLIQA